MSHFYDKSLNPLLSENAGHQSHSDSDAPSQRLWRPDSSSPESSETENRERHRKRFSVGQRVRRAFFVGALTIGLGLLVLWLFLLLTDDSPKKVKNSTIQTSSSLPPLILNKVTISQQRNGSDEQRQTTDKKERAQKQKQRHPQVIHVTAPSPTTTAGRKGGEVVEKGTRTATPKEPNTTAIYMDTLNMSKEWEQRTQIVVAQMERIGGTGRVAELTTESTTRTTTQPQTTTTSPRTTWTTKARTIPMRTNTAAETTTTTESTTTTGRGNSERQWTTKSEEEEEEEDNMLFWRGGYSGKHSQAKAKTDSVQLNTPSSTEPTRLWTTVSPTAANESLTEQQQLQRDGYNAMRPIIKFGPMNAMEVAGRARERQREEDEQQEEELNEIIASLEKDNSFSPVEIPFPVDSLPAIPIPEPVWRRPPPDGKALPPTLLPPKKPSSVAQVVVSDTHKTNAHAKAKLERKRREAPVIVTALLDIGRGEWPRFTRHFDQYLGYLANIVLRLQNRIIIYCDSLVTSYLQSLGKRINWERIQVVELSLQELPYYKFRNEIEEIMRWEQNHWHGDWDEQMRTHPETIYPDYDILVNSKPYFLLNATLISRFPKPLKNGQQFFVWLDAGYGHGSASEIPYGVWSPVLKSDKITLVQLTPKIDRVERYTLDKVYRKQKSVVSGGFLAGSSETIKRFHIFFHKSFLEMLDEKMVDDDQTTLLVTIQKYQSDFNIIFGGWFDAFKLLPSQ
ncbi:hypothetical protein niasHS_010772 [Heterodera schachtii]|uniref:Uncharacterized protein n=1 Tax=Heterodera schachtii TaxID=97005 RepID=A0ABD2IYN6_HETSC